MFNNFDNTPTNIHSIAREDIKPNNATALALARSLKGMQALDDSINKLVKAPDASDEPAPKKMTAIEQKLSSELVGLRNACEIALKSLKAKVRGYHELADSVSKFLYATGANSKGYLPRLTEAMRRIDGVIELSQVFAKDLNDLQLRLEALVATLEKVKKQHCIWKSVWKWSKRILKALSVTLAIAAAVAQVVPDAGPEVAAACSLGNVLTSEMANSCRRKEDYYINNSEKFCDAIDVLQNLKELLAEVRVGQKALAQLTGSDGYHFLHQVAIEMAQNELVGMNRRDAKKAAREWHAHCKQLQNVVSD